MLLASYVVLNDADNNDQKSSSKSDRSQYDKKYGQNDTTSRLVSYPSPGRTKISANWVCMFMFR